MRLHFSQKFNREYYKLAKRNREFYDLVKHRLYLLQESPYHPTLRLHKLSNRGEYAISVDQNIRIIFSREDDICYLISIGSHDDVY